MIRDVRRALADQLATIPGLHAHETWWPGSIVPPAALIKPLRGEGFQTFDGMVTHALEIILAVRDAQPRAGQHNLDDFLDQVLLAIAALGTPVVTRLAYRDYGELTIGNAVYIGAVVDVEVLVLP